MELIALDYATRYKWYVFPVRPREKTPLTVHGFKDATTDPAQIRAWWNANPDANIGVDCGRSKLVVIDLDGPEGVANWNALQTANIPQHKTATARTGSGNGYHIFYHAPEGMNIRSGNNKLAAHVDVKAGGGYVVLPPSVHPSGNAYEWQTYPDELAPLPENLQDLLTQPKPPPTNGNGNGAHADAFTRAEAVGRSTVHADEVMRAAEALTHLAEWRCDDREEWVNAGMSLCELGADGLQLWDTWSQRSAKYKAGECAELWKGFAPGKGFTLKSLHKWARDDSNGAYDPAKNQIRSTVHATGQGAANSTTVTNTTRAQWLSLKEITEAFHRAETGDAEILAQLCANQIAYDHTAKRWYFFGSTDAPHAWTRDRRAQVVHLVSNEVAAQYLYAAAELKRIGKATDDEIADYNKRAGALRFKGRIDRVLDLAKSQKAFAFTGDEWDADAMLLACPNGVLNLRRDSFQFRAGQARDYVRTTAAAEWQGRDAAAPRWEQFLDEIFAGNAEVIAFLRRWFGYCLTGQTGEDTFVVLHGEGGRNGKRILTETIASVMGEYAMSGDDDLLMDGRDNAAGAPKQFLLDIAGKRLVLLSETKKGARFHLARVKKLSGSDTIAARGMHALEGTQLRPTWKIVLSTNPMPQADPDDSAFFERLAVVEFSEQFVENPAPQNKHQHKRDPYLRAKLDAEAPGILAWLVRGCLEWQREGLNIPAQVKLTTNEYREQQDELAEYEQERLVRNPNAKARAGETYADYVKWAGQYADKKAMSSKIFAERMTKRFGKNRDTQGIYYIGVGLIF